MGREELSGHHEPDLPGRIGNTPPDLGALGQAVGPDGQHTRQITGASHDRTRRGRATISPITLSDSGLDPGHMPESARVARPGQDTPLTQLSDAGFETAGENSEPAQAGAKLDADKERLRLFLSKASTQIRLDDTSVAGVIAASAEVVNSIIGGEFPPLTDGVSVRIYPRKLLAESADTLDDDSREPNLTHLEPLNEAASMTQVHCILAMLGLPITLTHTDPPLVDKIIRNSDTDYLKKAGLDPELIEEALKVSQLQNGVLIALCKLPKYDEVEDGVIIADADRIECTNITAIAGLGEEDVAAVNAYLGRKSSATPSVSPYTYKGKPLAFKGTAHKATYLSADTRDALKGKGKSVNTIDPGGYL